MKRRDRPTSHPGLFWAVVALGMVLTGAAWDGTTHGGPGGSARFDPQDELPFERPAVPRVDTLYGSRNLVVGQEENYRVRIKPGATWPLSYRWNLGDGTKSIGNNVVHHFDEPGRYRLSVEVMNRYGSDSMSVWVSVTEPIPAVREFSDGAVTDDAGQALRGKEQRAQPVTIIPHEEVSGTAYYSWVLGTYLNRGAANAAARQFGEMGLTEVRVYTDASGKGATAYRIVSGQYHSTERAVAAKKRIEALVERPVQLLAFGH